MKKEFVPYEIALALKELGFDEPCFRFFDQNNELELFESNMFDEDKINSKLPDINNFLCDDELPKFYFCADPTYSQAFRFFREKHDLVHRIDRDGGWWICAILNLYDEKDQGAIEIYLENSCQNLYEEAELACLKKLIEIVKDGK